MVYFVTYDLRAPERNYEDLIRGLESFGKWWHQTGSCWLIVTSKSTVEVRDYLMQFIDSNDKLFVIQVIRNWAGIGFTENEYMWLRSLPDTAWNIQ